MPNDENPADESSKASATQQVQGFSVSEDDILALSPESRVTLAKYGIPGSKAEKLPLGDGETLSARMRHRGAIAEGIEQRFPDAQEMENVAPETWAEHRTNQAKWREELEGKIRACRLAFEQGNVGALFDALMFASSRDGCLFGIGSAHGDHWVGVPRWAVDAFAVWAGESIRNVPIRSRGRGARWSAQWEQDQVDLERWTWVKRVRQAGVPFTDDKVYEEAARYVGGEAGVSAAAVKDSYRKVQKRMKSEPGRYLDLEFGRLLNRPD